MTSASAYSELDYVDPTEKTSKKSFEQTFISSNIAISNWFNGVTRGIDRFLINSNTHSDLNQSVVKIENSTYSTEGKDLSNQTVILLSPRFPNFEKYWNLKFSTYDDQSDSRSVQKTLIQSSPRETNYGASIGLFKKIGKIRTSFQPRIELQNPLKVSHSIVFETILDYIDFKLNPRLDFFASSSRGTGVFQSLNFNFIIDDELSLTLINEGTYEEKLHKYSFTNGFSLGQTITDSDAMSYNLLFFANNRDNYHLDSYSLSTTWHHLFYKKILDLQLTPHLDFSKLSNFKGEAGLTLRLTVIF